MSSNHRSDLHKRPTLDRRARIQGSSSRNLDRLSHHQITLGQQACTSRPVQVGKLRRKAALGNGCRSGWFSEFEAATEGRRVVSAVPSMSSLSATIRPTWHTCLNVARAAAERLPFRRSSMDSVVGWELLDHIPEGSELHFPACVRLVLCEDGMLCPSPLYQSPISASSFPANWLMGHADSKVDIRLWLTERAGMRSTRIDVRDGLWGTLSSCDMHISKWTLRRPPLLESSTRGCDDRGFGDRSRAKTMSASLHPIDK